MVKRKETINNKSEGKKKSILDKVMEVNSARKKANFDPARLAAFVIQDLPEKPQEIIKRRFGLEDGESKTLEEIGRKFGVTRERIRQIESQAREIIRKKLKEEAALREIQHVKDIFEGIGGIASLNLILDRILGPEKKDSIKGSNVNFILETSDDFIKFPADDYLYSGYALDEGSINKARKVSSLIFDVLNKIKRPLLEKEIISEIKKNYSSRLSNEFLKSILDLSAGIDVNSFGEWGLNNWQEIKPRSIREKAYIVLKKHGSPVHFTEVANLINRAVFDSRMANPSTVHNELIKDNRFVLIGRGIYALSEWGFKSGTVSNIIKNILEEEKKPLSKKEIVDRVLKQRQVQINTIILALKNKGIKRD